MCGRSCTTSFCASCFILKWLPKEHSLPKLNSKEHRGSSPWRTGSLLPRTIFIHSFIHIRLGVRARDVAQRIFRKEVKWIGGLDARSNPRDGPSGQSPGFTPGTQTSTGSDYGDEVFKGRCLSRFVLSDLPSQSSGRTCMFLHFYFILFCFSPPSP